jgi:hypothetical protein
MQDAPDHIGDKRLEPVIQGCVWPSFTSATNDTQEVGIFEVTINLLYMSPACGLEQLMDKINEFKLRGRYPMHEYEGDIHTKAMQVEFKVVL